MASPVIQATGRLEFEDALWLSGPLYGPWAPSGCPQPKGRKATQSGSGPVDKKPKTHKKNHKERPICRPNSFCYIFNKSNNTARDETCGLTYTFQIYVQLDQSPKCVILSKAFFNQDNFRRSKNDWKH